MKNNREVKSGGLGAALATLIVLVATWFGAPEPPTGLEGALATVIGVVVGVLVGRRTAPIELTE